MKDSKAGHVHGHRRQRLGEGRGMRIEEDIAQNRRELIDQVLAACPNNPHTDDEELELWILNTPHLYYAAQQAGVDDCQED